MADRFERFKPRYEGKGANGRRLCVWCGVEVPKGKRRWCGQACVKEMQIQHWPAVWTKTVLQRDNWTCQLCGFNGVVMDHILQYFRRRGFQTHRRHEQFRSKAIDDYSDHDAAHRWLTNYLEDLGFTRGIELMQADHIVPIVEGGTNTLENGRTLCQPCHKAETRKLARRRSRLRRRERPDQLDAYITAKRRSHYRARARRRQRALPFNADVSV